MNDFCKIFGRFFSPFCNSRRFVISTFCNSRRFVISPFCNFAVLLFAVLYPLLAIFPSKTPLLDPGFHPNNPGSSKHSSPAIFYQQLHQILLFCMFVSLFVCMFIYMFACLSVLCVFFLLLV